MPRVLVVDDDPQELTFACRVLGAHWLTMAATCAADAIRMARSSPPDAIVLDVIMQGEENGFAVFRELGNNPETSAIPVIFLTNVNRTTGLDFGPAEMRRYLGRAPAAFLEKPVTPETLIHAVEKAVGRPRAG